MPRTVWNFYSAGRIAFGQNAVARLAPWLAKRQYRRVLMITDAALVHAGIAAAVSRPLEGDDFELVRFDGGEPEPSLDSARAAAAVALDFRPEAIIGLGGGSNMDLAKMAALMQQHHGDPRSYFGFDNVPGPVTPLVCIPTTSGTGSEVSHAAVLTDKENRLKVSILSPFLRPALAIVDPLLTLSCPPRTTADSGIDALTHAIEAYTATDFDRLEAPADADFAYDGRHPWGMMFAEKAIALIGRHLLTAVHEPGNLEAREGMALAATTAGLAFSNCGVAAVHALEYPLGGDLHVTHGAGNGLLLPHVMRFNLPARTKELARIAALLGEPTAGMDEHAAAERAILAVEKLRDAIGVPARIRDLHGKRESLPAYADRAYGITRLMLLNGRRPTRDDLLAIYEAAF